VSYSSYDVRSLFALQLYILAFGVISETNLFRARAWYATPMILLLHHIPVIQACTSLLSEPSFTYPLERHKSSGGGGKGKGPS
jgi:hypothetical protein